MSDKLDVVIVGGGMITHDQILPSIYQLKRLGHVGTIKICALNSPPLKELADSPAFAEAFPGLDFEAFPSLDTPARRNASRDVSRGDRRTVAAEPWWSWPCRITFTTT